MEGRQSREEIARERETLRSRLSELERELLESREALQAAAEARARYEALLDRSLLCVYIHDLQGRFLEANRAALDLLGYRPEDIPSLNIVSLVDETDLPLALDAFQTLLREGAQHRPSRYRLRARDGTRVWVEAETCLLNRPGAPPRILGIARDITPQKESEAGLPESERRGRDLLELLPETVFEVDLEGNLLFANRAAYRIFGYTEEDIRSGVKGRDMFAPEDRERAERNRARRLHGEAFWGEEYTAVRKDGTRFPVAVYSNPVFRDGAPAGLRGIIVDITRRKQTEEALRRSEEKYRFLVENANDAVFVLQDNCMKFHNRRAEEVTGYASEELRQIPFIEHVHPEDREMVLDRHLRRLGGESFPSTYPFRVGNKRQDTLWVEINAVLIPWEERPAVLCIIRDITEVKNLEDQLQQARRMEAVGRLAGGIAHDFNNMMTVVTGYSEILLQRLSPEDPAYRSVREIKRAGDHAAQLTRQILAFSRRQMLQPRVMDLNRIVRGMDPMLRRVIGENLELHVALAPGLGCVKADPAQMEQVIVNLVINARDAMPQGGRLSIQTADVDLPGNTALAKGEVPGGTYVMLSVTDTGAGMDEETVNRAFEPFFTTKRMDQGTGLGLSTVYGIVKQSDGHVTVESAPGKGSVFRVYLPRVQEAPEPDVLLAMEPAAPVDAGKTVLVVEDEDSVRDLVRKILSRNGYQVLEAADGEEALTASERHGREIDLLVTDVMMPRMSGPELFQRLSRARPSMRVLYISGYADLPEIPGEAETVSTIFLEKPFTPEDLLRKVRDLTSP